MGELASSFSGIQRASWEATCAPDDDVSVPQPQHLSTNNNYPPSSERPIKKKRRRNGMQEAPRVVGQVGMPNPAPRPRRTIKKFAPEEQIAEEFPGRSPDSLKVKYCTERKNRPAKIDEANQRVPPSP
ncbi:hypothetical protein RAB80_014443 [Fusarium oxysporum f. sp. vasinfectum]|nr:hypothetical protein RAB80_014443 [Fusarium oxysporum f. sp. vasinfectum]KAK2926637.1 hypothetical protein FoTM2_013506 [Fusarium oxysporum f. sp. vasinfectum]